MHRSGSGECPSPEREDRRGGTGTNADKADQRWTVTEVITAMDAGHQFYTQGKASGKTAWVEKYWCSACGAWHIRSVADAVTDNNLDSLRACSWQR